MSMWAEWAILPGPVMGFSGVLVGGLFLATWRLFAHHNDASAVLGPVASAFPYVIWVAAAWNASDDLARADMWFVALCASIAWVSIIMNSVTCSRILLLRARLRRMNDAMRKP